MKNEGMVEAADKNGDSRIGKCLTRRRHFLRESPRLHPGKRLRLRSRAKLRLLFFPRPNFRTLRVRASVNAQKSRTSREANGSVQKVGVSRGLHQWRRGGRDRLKQVTESRAERAVVDRTRNLQQQVGASSRPSHLPRFVHPPIDQEVGHTFSHRRSDAQACTVSFGIIDEPSALATEIVIGLVQRAPQLAGWHTRRAVTAIALEDMHSLADALECEPGIPGLAVPDPPMQSLNLRDDRRLCLDPTRGVGGQSTRCLPCVLQPHGDVEPVRNRRLRDAGLGQYRSKAGTTLAERSQRGGGGSADRLKTAPDQHRDIRTGFRDSAEDLPTAFGRLDVADANLQMPFPVVAATDEGRVYRVTVMLAAAAAGLTAGASRSRPPILSVWPSKVSGLFPASTGRRCASTPAATRYGTRAEKCACSWSSSGVDRQCDGQLTHVSL